MLFVLICMLKQNLVYFIIIYLDDDFLINISAEIIDNKLVGFVRIRSKVKGIVVSLGEKIK